VTDLPDQTPRLSVIIAVHNGERIIQQTLDALAASSFTDFETVVVDDASTDRSAELIARFPVRLVRLERNLGAGYARNEGARQARGDILFITDQDCLVEPETLGRAVEAAAGHPRRVVGGTYTTIPADRHFFASSFQSLHVHYFETKLEHPDYVAAHAMVMDRQLFLDHGGFPEEPIMGKLDGLAADVQLCREMRRDGVEVVADPTILVRHDFGFTIWKSLENAARKSYTWTRYALNQSALFTDSGSASTEMKLGGIFSGLFTAALPVAALAGSPALWLLTLLPLAGAIWVNRRFYGFIRRERGLLFMLGSVFFYTAMLDLILVASALATVRHLAGGRGPDTGAGQ
jgi:glycosyltransferase involved in cell wall biosynthesis